VVRWWWLGAAFTLGAWAVRPLERVLPPDVVLFAREGTVYRLRVPSATDSVTLARDVRTLQEVSKEPMASPPREDGTASGAVLVVPPETTARALEVMEDEVHRPVIKLRVLDGPYAGMKGYVWRSALGREASWRPGFLTPLAVLGAAAALGIAVVVRALWIVATEQG
jgi:hypothetical protein